ncbi:lipopolysaccharide biosynthesis protein [Demequina salsinemoris]|uniref:lipopolysaccharide biosynthesis protein n=1 Tax=Demequina salsinemoris TaxID=577470 RepID=UPI000AA3526B|nr:hypothetical protein [Demequina salsinemoris]
MKEMALWRSLVGFSAIPALGALSPLVALPVVARAAGPSGWSSAIAGESVGTFAAILLAYGWTTVGPARVAQAPPVARARLYRESLVIRGLMAIPVFPALIGACLVVATDGYELLTVLMGIQGALIALSFAWFAVGVNDPGSIARLDAVPRVLGALVAAGLVAATGVIAIYPILGILVTLLGTIVYTRRILRALPGSWPSFQNLPAVLRSTSVVVVNDMALGSYAAVPVPLVNTTTSVSAAAASAYASADKMVKLGQFLPLTLSNALQSWTAADGGEARAKRVRQAIIAHATLGIAGWAFLVLCGPWASRLLFGEQGAEDSALLCVLGIAFAAFSIRTSLTRHLLFPCGEVRIVAAATLAGSALGVPLMIGLAPSIGTLGVAVGYTATEVLSTAIPLVRAVSCMRRIAELPTEGSVEQEPRANE